MNAAHRTTRVLFAIGSMGGGGAERQTIQYLRFLDRKRFEPRLYLHQHTGELLAHVPPDVPVTAFSDRCRPPRMYFPGRIHRLQVRDLAATLAEDRIDCLCAVTLHMSLVAGGAVRQARSASGRAVPWLAIEMADPRLDFEHQVRRFRWLKRRLLRRAYQHANAVIAVSDGVRAGIAAYHGVPVERIATVRNFIDVADVQRQAAVAGPGLAPDVFHLVTVGRLDAQKGQVGLLQAMEELVHRRQRRQIQLHLLGQGPLEQSLRKFVQQANLTAHVSFHGFVPNPFAFVARCQLFCLPSVYEGLPLALLEAMACRVPVVAADCPSGPAEVLDGGRFGRLVPPEDAAALADAIADAVDCYNAWTAVADAAVERVAQAFSPQSEMPKLERLIEVAIP